MGEGGINFCLKSDATILAAWLFIHDTGRFLPISASLPATLEESSTSLARMETSPFSTGFHYHHSAGNLRDAINEKVAKLWTFAVFPSRPSRRAFVESRPYFCDFARLFVILATFRAILSRLANR